MIKVGKTYTAKDVKHHLVKDKEVTTFMIQDGMIDRNGYRIKYPDGNPVMYHVQFTVFAPIPLVEGQEVTIGSITSWNPYQDKVEKTGRQTGKAYFKYVVHYSMTGSVNLSKDNA